MDSTQQIINRVIQQRRSVKPEKYNPQRVDDVIVEQMLENARWAPTHGLTEPWRFVVFTQNGLKQFADFQSELYRAKTPENEFKEAKYLKLRETPPKVSHLIMIGMKRQEIAKIPEQEEICAVACAVQNMQLTATAYGIASYWSTGGMTYRAEMKTYLGLGENDKCLGMLYVGNYSGEPLSGNRTSVEDKTTWVR